MFFREKFVWVRNGLNVWGPGPLSLAQVDALSQTWTRP